MNVFYVPPVRSDELYHYGIAGRSGRYPLGSGDRPYQRQGRKKGFLSRAKQSREASKKAKKEDLARQIEEAKRIKAENKDRVLQSGKASEVLQYKGELTNKELKDAVDRLRLESDLSKYSREEVQSGMDKMDKIMKDFDKVIDWGSTATKAWNLFAKAYNATLEEGEKKLAIL